MTQPVEPDNVEGGLTLYGANELRIEILKGFHLIDSSEKKAILESSKLGENGLRDFLVGAAWTFSADGVFVFSPPPTARVRNDLYPILGSCVDFGGRIEFRSERIAELGATVSLDGIIRGGQGIYDVDMIHTVTSSVTPPRITRISQRLSLHPTLPPESTVEGISVPSDFSVTVEGTVAGQPFGPLAGTLKLAPEAEPGAALSFTLETNSMNEPGSVFWDSVCIRQDDLNYQLEVRDSKVRMKVEGGDKLGVSPTWVMASRNNALGGLAIFNGLGRLGVGEISFVVKNDTVYGEIAASGISDLGEPSDYKARLVGSRRSSGVLTTDLFEPAAAQDSSSKPPNTVKGIPVPSIFDVSIEGKTDSHSFGPLEGELFIMFAFGGEPNSLLVSLVTAGDCCNGWIVWDSPHLLAEPQGRTTSATRLRIEEKHLEVELSPGQSIQQEVRWFTSPEEASPDLCLGVQVTAAKLSVSVEDKHLVGTLIGSGEYYWNTLHNPRSSYEARLEGELKASLAPELSDAAAEPFSFARRWFADEMTFGEMQFQTAGERLTGEFSGGEEGTIQGVVDGRRADFTWMSKSRRGWGLIRAAGATRLLAGLWGSAEDKSDARGMTAMAEEPATFNLPDVIVADRSRLRFLGYELLGAGKTEAAIAAFEKALALCREAETTGAYLDKENCLVDELLILSHLIAAHFKLGDYQRWIDHLQRTLEIQRRLSPQANVKAIFDHSIARIKEAVVENSGFIRQFTRNLAALHNELDVTPPAANSDVAATLPEEQKDRLDGKVIYLRAYLDSLLEMLNECESLMDVLKAKSDAWKVTSVDALQSLELLSEDLRESLETGIWKIVSWVEETFKAHEDLLESAISLFRHFHPSPASAAQINYDAVVEAEEKTYALLDSTAEMSRIEKAFFFEALRLVPSLSTLAFQALCAKENIAGRQLTAAAAEQAENTRAALRHLSDSLETWRSRLVTDIDKIEILTSGQPFFQELIRLLIELGNYDEALVVSEKARARALADLMAARGNFPADTDTTALETDRIPSIASARPPDRETILRITKEHNAFIVEYTILDSPSSTLCIWVVNPGGDINFRQYDLQHLFGDQITSLEVFIGKTRHDLGHGGYRLRNLTYQTNPPSVPSLTILYQILIHPIVDLLPGDDDTPVIFIPQGPLFQVPFAALQDLSGRYLIDKHPILIAPSIQILEWTRKRREKISASPNETALVVGNPKPAAASSKGSWPDPLMELPGAEIEARRIAERLKTNALIGEQAGKKQIIGMMADKRIIHFATHGLLDDAGGVDIPGAILLAGSDEDDGLLTSSEIMRLNLDSELVVLSACDTGRGRATGDGVIGLSRAFLLAGVPSVVVSLWAIPDAPTALLMEEFYSNVLRGANKAQALRRAMLAAKELHCDPFDWAAFMILGEAE